MYPQDSARTRILLVSALIGIVIVFLFSILFFNIIAGNKTPSTTSTPPSPTATHIAAPSPTIPPTPTPAPLLPTIANAGFETPALGTGYQYNIAGNAWQFNSSAGGGSGITGNQSGFTSGNPNAPAGTQVAFIQATGTISQTLHFDAGKYIIGFQAAQRGNFQHGDEDFQLLIDGTIIGNFFPGNTSYATFSSTSFTVTAGDHALVFQGIDSKGGDNSVFIDAITIAFA
jgi:hypothetical protein